MSEIKGQLLGVILVLMIFGTVSVAMIAIFNSLTDKAKEQVNEIIGSSSSSSSSKYLITNFVTYQ